MIFVNPNAKSNKNTPNISLAYAATVFGSKVIDQNTMNYPADRFLIAPSNILAISIQTRTLKEAERIKKEYLKKYPESKIKTVSTAIDIQCCYPYLEWPDGIVFKKEFGDEYPFPDYELFDSFPIFEKNWRSGDWKYAIMTSLGCPYSCDYCMCKNRKWKFRSARNSFEELNWAKEKWGIKKFQILDDCFNFNEERVIEFCEMIKPLGLSWSCTNGVRADKFSEKMAKAMKESGCEEISIGIESSDPEILKSIKKGETIEQIERAIISAKKYFNKVNGYFIIGLPGSSYEKDLASVNWSEKMVINAHFSYHVPAKEGVIESDALFYGEGAKPTSDAYPKELQKKIYNLTAPMRPRSGMVGHAGKIKRRLLGIAKKLLGSF